MVSVHWNRSKKLGKQTTKEYKIFCVGVVCLAYSTADDGSKRKRGKKNILNDGNRWTLLKKEKEIVNNNEKNNLVYVHFRTDELPGKRERRDARRRCHLKFRSIFHGYKSWKRNSQRMYTCFFVSRILYLLQVD